MTGPSTTTAVIEMEEVRVASFGDASLTVASGINWRVAAGDYWVVAGLQGCGKSDFLMMTGGLMAPASGVYRLFGERMPIFDEERLPTRLRLGLVFDGGGRLFNQLTVRENVALPLRYHQNLAKSEVEGQVHELLEAVGLSAWADRTPGALGQNWQKRVGLARALILAPEVLLVDNPLAGLDLRYASWWLNFLRQLSSGHPLLHGRPMTLVVSTAELRPWKDQACQFAVLKDQQLAVVGAREQLAQLSGELLQELLPDQ
jgi:ABC-type transporter Mla maintaining outer membrane lipid asymmetry ATPase subunit MlaF